MESYQPKSNKTLSDFQMEMCELIAKFPSHCSKLEQSPVAVLREAIRNPRDKDQSQYWILLSEFFIRLGDFDLGREIFEEALDVEAGVSTVREFSIVFNAWLQFERQMIFATEQLTAEQPSDEAERALEEQFARVESLIQRREVMLCEVLLRNQPNDVQTWLHRIQIAGKLGDRSLTAAVFARAIQTIDPAKAIGSFSRIWIQFARHFETADADLENANLVFHKAT